MKFIRISCALVVMTLLAGAEDFATLAQRAVQLQQAGQYRESAAAYRELLKLDPSQVATHVNLAIVLVKLGEFEEAIQQYGEAERLLPGDPRIALNVALAYEKSGKVDEACRRLEALHQEYPDERQPTLLLADCNLQLGKDARVVELLKPMATASGDGDLGVDYMLGMALLHQHNLDEGQLYLDRILKHGDTAQSRFLLGTRMFEGGDYAAAVKQLASAAELDPKLPQLQSVYGQALLNTGDPEAAEAAFRLALAADGADFNANLGLAQILEAGHRYAEALPFAERACSLRQANAGAQLVTAQSLAGLKRYAEARPYAAQAASVLPRSLAAQRTAAEVYGGLGERAGATASGHVVRELEMAEQAAAPSPKVNEQAPDFELPRSGQPGSIALRSFQGKRPVVLIFGSYTCPNFRSSADALKLLERRYGARVRFLLVYIREAHSTVDWQSGRNTRAGVDMQPASNMAEKQEHASACSRQLHLPFPAVVDGMDDRVESAYHAWPSRAFVVGADGRVLYSTRLTELDFEPAQMEAVLRKIAGRQTS